MRPLCSNRRISPNTILQFRWETIWVRVASRMPMLSQCTNANVRAVIHGPMKCYVNCTRLQCSVKCMCLSLGLTYERPLAVSCKWQRQPACQPVLVCHCLSALQPSPPASRIGTKQKIIQKIPSHIRWLNVYLPWQNRIAVPMFCWMPSILLGSIGVCAMTNNWANANLHRTVTSYAVSMFKK